MTDAIPEPNTLTVRLVISPIAAPDPWRTSATGITDGLTTAIKPLSNKILRFRPNADVKGAIDRNRRNLRIQTTPDYASAV